MVYLVGLLVSIFVIIVGGNLTSYLPDLSGWIPQLFKNPNPNPDTICNILSFGDGQLSSLSIGQMIIGFSFSYLLTTMLIGEYNLVSSNWPTIIFFSLLMLAEILVNTNITEFTHQIMQYFRGEAFKSNEQYTYCYNWYTSLFTYALAGGLGTAYAYIISGFDNPNLQYFPNYKNNEKCGKIDTNSKKTFACRVFKNGSKSTDPTQIVTAPTSGEQDDSSST
jgi:hypothetical protein